MKTKYLLAVLPVAALMLGASMAYAHGPFIGSRLDPTETTDRYEQMFEREANILGVNPTEVKTAWAEGKSIWQLAEEKGISAEELKTKMHTQARQQLKEHLDSLVQAGVITQEQANTRLQTMESRFSQSNYGRMGHGRGMMRGLKF